MIFLLSCGVAIAEEASARNVPLLVHINGNTAIRALEPGKVADMVLVDASLLGWLAQSYADVLPILVFTGVVATIVVTGAVFWINRSAFRRMQRIEES